MRAWGGLSLKVESRRDGKGAVETVHLLTR